MHRPAAVVMASAAELLHAKMQLRMASIPHHLKTIPRGKTQVIVRHDKPPASYLHPKELERAARRAMRYANAYKERAELAQAVGLKFAPPTHVQEKFRLIEALQGGRSSQGAQA